jgi:uncharacterized protein YjdB
VTQGETRQLTAIVTDSLGNAVTDRSIEWTSSDPSRATVNSTGLVSTLAAGSVQITAASENRSGTANVTIQQVPVDSIVTSNTYIAIINDVNKSFAITLRDVNGNQIFNRSVSVQSSDPSVATGSANSQATIVTLSASKQGTATFTLRALNSNNQPEGKASTVVVTINPVPTPSPLRTPNTGSAPAASSAVKRE